MALEAVLWDLDGTLVDSERENVESVILAARRYGAELDDATRRFIVGHSWNEIHELITRTHRLSVSMPELIAAAVDEKRALVERTGYRALPGARELVARLGARVPMAVVSGASCVEVRDAVDGLGLTPAFRFLMGAEDYQRGKPHPEPYLMAMQRLGVAAAGCLVVEDAEPGIVSGRAAGARVVAVRAANFVGYDLSAAHAVVNTLEEVTDDLIATLFAAKAA